MIKRFEELQIWRRSYDLTLKFYKYKMNFPLEERFGIESQLKRAIVSVPANIAEGCQRQHKKEFIHFLFIAKGSLSEARCYFMLCKDLGILPVEDWREFNNECNTINRMIDGYIKQIKNSL